MDVVSDKMKDLSNSGVGDLERIDHATEKVAQKKEIIGVLSSSSAYLGLFRIWLYIKARDI